MPGVGAIAAMAVETFAPDLTSFSRSRDFAAWLGLTPREHSSGGKQRLGQTSKMGEPRHPKAADHRRHEPHRQRTPPPPFRRHPRSMEPWLAEKLERKPRMVAAIAEPPRWRASSGPC